MRISSKKVMIALMLDQLNSVANAGGTAQHLRFHFTSSAGRVDFERRGSAPQLVEAHYPFIWQIGVASGFAVDIFAGVVA